jgi:hypothetical protein
MRLKFKFCILERDGMVYRHLWLCAVCLLWPVFLYGMELKGNDVTFEISEKNGELISADMKNSPKSIVGSDDFYLLENREKKVQVDAAEDIVKAMKQGKNEVTFDCQNPELKGLVILKRYQLVDGIILAKRVEIQSEGEEGFFTWVQGIKLSPEFRKNAYYYRVMFALSGPGPMILDADKADNGMICSNRVACIQRDSLVGVGQYVYTVHDQWAYDFQAEGHKVFTPSGWQMAVAEDYVSREKTYFAETHTPLFKGDHLTFHQIYFDQPKVHEVLFRPRPSWIKDVRTILNYSPWWVQKHEADQAGIRITSNHFDEGYIVLQFMSSWSGATAGYYPTTGPFVQGGGATQEIKDIIKKVRDLSQGKYKIGLYSVSQLSSQTPAGKEHPEWRMQDKKGNDYQSRDTDDQGVVYRLNFSLPEVKQYFAEQYRNIAYGYGIDQLFIDLGSRPDSGPQDWLHKDVYQGYDNYNAVMCSMFDAVKSVKDREMSTMGNSPCAAIFDLTYLEHGIASDWKQNSAMVQYGKFTECTGSRMCVLGWDTQRVYAPEYVLALGLIPAQFSPCWIMNDVPVFEATYEMRATRLVDGIIKPRWWLDGSDTECYGLQQGKSKFVNTIGHRDITTQINVAIEPAKFGLAKGTNIYLWEHVPFDRRIFRGLVRVDADELQLQMPSVRDGAALMSFSDVPAVIYSINDRPCRIFMSEQPEVQLDGKLDQIKGELTLTADTKKKKIEILAYYPQEQGEPLVTIDNQKVPAQAVKIHRQDGERFLLIPVTTGKHQIKVTYDLAKPEKRSANIYIPPTATIKRCAKPPVLDGWLDDECWKTAAVMTDFVAVQECRRIPDAEQTLVKATYDRKNLYVSFTCMDPKTPELVARYKDYNSMVYMDHAVEVFLDTAFNRSKFMHIITNIEGAMYCEEAGLGKDLLPSPIAEVKTSREKDRWLVEMIIPFNKLNLKAPPMPNEKWGVNLCRDGHYFPGTQWAWTRGYGFLSPALFGTWIFE